MRFQLSSVSTQAYRSSVLVSSLLLVQILTNVAAAPVPATNKLQLVDLDDATGDAVWGRLAARDPSAANRKGNTKPKLSLNAPRDEPALAEEESDELAFPEEEGDEFDQELFARGAAGIPKPKPKPKPKPSPKTPRDGEKNSPVDKIGSRCSGADCGAARSELDGESTVTRRATAQARKAPSQIKKPEAVKPANQQNTKNSKVRPGNTTAGSAGGGKAARDEAALGEGGEQLAAGQTAGKGQSTGSGGSGKPRGQNAGQGKGTGQQGNGAKGGRSGGAKGGSRST